MTARGRHVSGDGSGSRSAARTRHGHGYGRHGRNHVGACMVVKAASVEAIADNKWSSRAYGRGWRWSKAHSATPAAESSHSSAHAKSRNRSTVRAKLHCGWFRGWRHLRLLVGPLQLLDGRTPSAQQHFLTSYAFYWNVPIHCLRASTNDDR
jgi:hypothetical protein